MAKGGMAKPSPPRSIEADILRRLDALGLRQKDLADHLGIETNKISKVRSGERQLKADEALSARAWLSDQERLRASRDVGKEPDLPPTRSASANDDTVEIHQLDLSFSMGPGTTIDDYIEETPLRFDLGYIRSFTRTVPHRLRLAKGVGESMAPTLLSSDMVWIDTTQTMLNQQDRIWAVSLFGAAAIKRLRTIGGGRVLVISDNPGVDNQEVDAEDVIIGGRVIRFARDL